MKFSDYKFMKGLFISITLLVIAVPLAGLVGATLQYKVLEPYLEQLFIVTFGATVCLGIIIGVYTVRLILQWRSRVPGSRLTVQFLGTYTLLTLASLLIVYYYSFYSLSRGVDSWFDTQTDQALATALSLGNISIETLQNDVALALEDTIEELISASDAQTVKDVLNVALGAGDFMEITYFRDIESAAGIVVSSEIQLQSGQLVPTRADEQTINNALAGKTVGEILPDSAESMLRILIPVPIQGETDPNILQVLTPLPRGHQDLVDKVDVARQSYENLVVVRESVKFNLIVTLTFIAAVALMISLWLAIELTKRLVKPIQVLSEGTRAVAMGDYDRQLPVSTQNDIGVLVESFNNMTSEIKSSHEQVRNSQRNAEEQRTYLESVLQHLSSGVFSLDQQLRIIDMNLAALKILGLQTSDIEGKTLADIVQANSRLEPLKNFVESGVLGGLADWNKEVRLESAIRSTQTLICSATKLPLLAANSDRFVCVMEEVTELVKAQRGAAWGEVAQRFAHEIRNPLTPIQLAVDRIRMKTVDRPLRNEDREAVKRAIDAIYRQLQSMQNIVIEFRDYAQITAMNPSSVNLNNLIEETVELHSAGGQFGEIISNLDPAIGTINADPDRLRQVLNNLILNARAAMEEIPDPKMTISTRQVAPESIEIELVDNGPGFEPAMIDEAFDPYTTSKRKGTGLGLAIVRRIVEEHGGRVFASNCSTIGGGRVTIQLKSDGDDEIRNLNSDNSVDSVRDGTLQ